MPTSRIIILADGSQASAEADKLALKFDATGKLISDAGSNAATDFGKSFDDLSTKGGNALKKIGSQLESLSIPGGNAISKMGEQFANAETGAQKLSATVDSIGKVGIAAGIAGFVALAAAGIKGAMDLQKQMEMIHTQAGASQAEVVKMTSAVKGMAASVGTGPLALSEALYHVESVGKRGADALKVLKTAAEGAKIGNSDLTDTTNALDATVISGMPGVKNYTQAMGMLNATVGAGDMTMQDLANAMGTGIDAVAGKAGVSLRSLGAALATFGDNNIRGSKAAIYLRQMITSLVSPSLASVQALNSIGLKSTQLGEQLRTPDGIVGALTTIKQHLDSTGMDATEQASVIDKAFGGVKSGTGVTVLLGELDRLKTKYADVGSGAQKFGADWTATQHTLSFQLDQLRAGAESFADTIGADLIPKIEDFGNFVANNKGTIEDFAKVLGVVLAASAAYFAANVVTRWVQGVGTIVQGIQGWVLKQSSAAAGLADSDGTIMIANGDMMQALQRDNAAIIESAQQMSSAVQTSFNELASEAETVQLKFDTAVASMADTVAGEDAAIESSNAAAGASFTAMLGPIAAVSAAALALHGTITSAVNSVSNKVFGTTSTSSQMQAQYNAAYNKVKGNPSEIAQLNTEAAKAAKSFGFTLQEKGVPLTGGRPASSLAADAVASAAATKTASKTSPSSLSSALQNVLNGNPTTSSSTGVPSITPAQVALENSIIALTTQVKNATAGGTSFSQQASTLAKLRAVVGTPASVQQFGPHTPIPATSGVQGTAASLEAAAKASGNSTLASKASTLSSDLTAAIAKIPTIVDADIKSGQSMEQTLLTDAANSNAQTLRTDLSNVHKTQMQELVSELVASGTESAESLASQLKSSWASAEASLVAQNNDLTTIANADQLNITAAGTTAQTTINQDAANATVTATQLASQASQDASAAQVQIAQLTSTQLVDSMTAATQQITLAATAMHDAATAQTQQTSDATQAITDQGNATVSAINDQTQTQVDTINERGKWGLNLVAQQEQVALDQATAANDAQINAQILHNDNLKTQDDAAVAAATANADAVAQQAAQAVATAQALVDSTAITEAQNVAAAQAASDAQAQINAAIEAKDQAAQDAQAQTDAIKVATAQAHVDAVQWGTASQQNAAQAALDYAQGVQANDAATYGAATQAATNIANTDAASSAAYIATVTAAANTANQNAQSSLASTTAMASQSNANAAAALQASQDAAAQDAANGAQTLSLLQSSAATQEATLKQQLAVTQAMAATQFAGGTQISIVGLQPTNAAAIADAVGWTLRTQSGAAS